MNEITRRTFNLAALLIPALRWIPPADSPAAPKMLAIFNELPQPDPGPYHRLLRPDEVWRPGDSAKMLACHPLWIPIEPALIRARLREVIRPGTFFSAVRRPIVRLFDIDGCDTIAALTRDDAIQYAMKLSGGIDNVIFAERHWLSPQSETYSNDQVCEIHDDLWPDLWRIDLDSYDSDRARIEIAQGRRAARGDDLRARAERTIKRLENPPGYESETFADALARDLIKFERYGRPWSRDVDPDERVVPVPYLFATTEW